MKAIITKYHPPISSRGSRISAIAEGGHRVSIPYPHDAQDEESAHRQAAVLLCEKLKGASPDRLIGGWLPGNNGYAFVFAPSGGSR